MFLNFQFLEFDEFRAAALQIEPPSRAIGRAVLARAHHQREERRRHNLITNIRVVYTLHAKQNKLWRKLYFSIQNRTLKKSHCEDRPLLKIIYHVHVKDISIVNL